MYVCICRAVSDGQIRDAACQGVCSLEDLSKCLGVGTGCGRCRQHASDLLTETLAEIGKPVISIALAA